ncbi:MAG: hypothetical protein PSV22_22760 [Pseudolabrys sp.]|nr:hypothetical protein [Pseudolabrys sp.]
MLHAPVLIRPFATGFALLLGLLATWIVAAELSRPSLGSFPANAVEAKAIALQNSAAATAAWIGWPRGELWADYAVIANAGSIGAMNASSPSRTDDHANGIAETAARLAPSDARPWLLLAMNAQADSNDAKTLALLKMSYYTSPYSDALFPLRIQVTTRSPGIADEELSSFVEYELGVVVGRKSDLKRSIAPAYRTASPAGRRFFETVLAKLDPAYLVELKALKP